MVNIENLKTLIYFPKYISFFSIIYSKCENEFEKIFKEKESIDILKFLGLFKNI